MPKQEASKTALSVAAMRAVHQLFDATPKILDDKVVVQLLGAPFVEQIQTHLARFQTIEANVLRSHILLRSRYAEDRLAKAIERGVQQYLILGAGFDTFPYRQPTWAHSLQIFEVDQPASQQEKRERLLHNDINVPANLEFVTIDFETTSLVDGLKKSSFDSSKPTFVSWLGVMMYLNQDAIDSVLKYVVALPSSSEIVFTFVPPLSSAKQVELAELAAKQGEPWKNYVMPEDLVQSLHSLGFTDITLPTSAELDAWYICGRQDGLGVSNRTLIASAIV